MALRFFLFPILSVFLLSVATAQKAPLPAFPTSAEERQWDSYYKQALGRDGTAPPAGPVRTMAEWEEVQALVITWINSPASWQDILVEITRYAVDECQVLIVTQNPTGVCNRLQSEGISLDSVQFIDHPFNSIWIRDYGPWTVYQNDVDSLLIVDWLYNRPRPQDDAVPAAVAGLLDLPHYQAISPPNDWVHTGGNHLIDGMTTAFSSDLVLDENPAKLEREIDAIARAYLGVQNYVKLPILPYDGIHHIDMHMRFIDEETVIIGEYPEGVADGPQIEENIRYLLSRQQSPFGNPYRVERIQMPPDQNRLYPDQGGRYRTYTNSIFINKTILVPTYEERYDTTALRIYRDHLPGYRVVGINCNAIIPALGALHCITKLVGSPDPLWIAHPRLRDTYDSQSDYPIQAILEHRSGIAEATLYYRTDSTQPYVTLPMAAQNDSLWTASIPAQPAGTQVQYYIEGIANSGKRQVRPIVAPEGYFRFWVRKEEFPEAGFFAFQPKACPGGAVLFTNTSRGGPNSYQWQFTGGTPATSTLAEPTVQYDTPGIYPVRLIAFNAQGADTLQLEDAIVVEAGNLPAFNGFAGGLGSGWTTEEIIPDGQQWEVLPDVGCWDAALLMNNYNTNTNETRDIFRSRLDLRGLSDVDLHFDLAYAPYQSGSQFFSDGLRIQVRNCQGEVETVFAKYANDLATVPAVDFAFTPTSCDEWRHEVVDLSDFSGQVIELEFVNVGGFGNRLFLDNIDFSSPDKSNAQPVVGLTQPAGDSLVSIENDPTFILRAEGSDPDGILYELSLWVNGDSLGASTTGTYTVDYAFSGPGTYEVVARAVDNLGAVRHSDARTIEVKQTVGLTRVNALPVRVFPNPSSGPVSVRLPGLGSERVHVQVIQADGRSCYAADHALLGGELRLDLGHLPAGTYFVRLVKGGQVGIARIALE